MKTISRMLMLEGIVLIIFGFLTFVFTGLSTIYALFFAGLGLIGLVVGLFMDFGDIAKSFKGRAGLYGSTALAYTAIFIAILVFVNIIAIGRNKQIDLTKVGIHTLSEQSQTVVTNLPGETKIVGFFKAGEAKQFEKLAERYQKLSEKISYEAIDPDLRPDLVKGYAVTEPGAIAISCQSRTTITMDMSEQGITSALLKVSQPAKGTTYYLEGHGEVPFEGQEQRGFALLKQGLENENIQLKQLMLLATGNVPPDAAMVIVNGPTNALVPEEIAALKAYLDQGGRMLVMLDPMTETGLDSLLAEYGVKVDNDIIVDSQVQLMQGAVLGYDPIVSDYGMHEITKKMGQNPSVFHLARSLQIGNEGKLEGVIADPLLRTSPDAWGETDFAAFEAGAEPTLEAGKDLAGPLVLGIAAERGIGEGEQRKDARMVVIGDADFSTNRYIPYGFNANLFLNVVNWLTGQEAYISVRANSFAPDMFTLDERQSSVIFLASVVLMPLMLIMLGIGVALFRKR